MTGGVDATAVLHLVNGEFYAGAERVQDLLALQLGHSGFDVQFACLKDGVFADKRRARNAKLHSFPMKSRADLSLCYRLARFVRSERVRLIHTHTPRTALVGSLVARLAQVPMVHHVHSPGESDTESASRNFLNSQVERVSLRTARRLIAVSGSLEKYLHDRGFAPASVCQVPNGVPVCETTRRDFAPGQELVAGTVALFRPRKGTEVLLEAMARLKSSGVRVRLHAVGTFETAGYRRSIMARVDSLGLSDAVTWVGFTQDVVAEFRRMHVFVLPSLFGEGMPMVILEAMAAGLPIVSTRVEGIPQVVRHGQDGLLTEAADPEGLADALLQIALGHVNPAALGDSGRRRQREMFSDVAMAARVAEIYRQVLS